MLIDFGFAVQKSDQLVPFSGTITYASQNLLSQLMNDKYHHHHIPNYEDDWESLLKTIFALFVPQIRKQLLTLRDSEEKEKRAFNFWKVIDETFHLQGKSQADLEKFFKKLSLI